MIKPHGSDKLNPLYVMDDAKRAARSGLDIVEGAKLYVDAYELNPPGSHFMQAGIVIVARALSPR